MAHGNNSPTSTTAGMDSTASDCGDERINPDVAPPQQQHEQHHHPHQQQHNPHLLHVATTRSSTGPPKMAFSRGAAMNGTPTTDSANRSSNSYACEDRHQQQQQQHRHHQQQQQPNETPLHRRLPSHQQQHNEYSDIEEDLGTFLLPTRSSSSSPMTLPIRRPWWHFETIRGQGRQLLRRMGNYLAYATLFTMLIVVPTVLYRAIVNHKLDDAAIRSSWVMVCGTFVLSLRLVYLHLSHWYMPQVQKYVVRILWMVPIYAFQSYLSLRFHHARVYMSTIRDFYEAYVIASFVYYLMELLGGQDALVQLLRHKDPSYGQHSFPLSLWLEPWEVGIEFMLQCKHGVLQYVVFKTTATVLTFVCEYAGVYGEGRFEWLVAYPYLCFFQNISVMYALYCLVKFFHAVNDDLRYPVDWHPLGKFLCIKGVVFFTWWQGVVIFYLRDHGIIEHLGTWSSLEVANGLIDYCIVVEMVFFAIAHSYTFTYTEYLPGRLPPPQSAQASVATGDGGGQHGDNSNNNNDDNNNTNPGGLTRSRSGYQPPETLHQPMRFTDALWSSTVPKETLQDIQRLRAGFDVSMHEAANHRPRAISLQELHIPVNNSLSTGEPEDAALTANTDAAMDTSAPTLRLNNNG